MKQLLIGLCLLVCLTGCGREQAVTKPVVLSPTPVVTATPTPTPTPVEESLEYQYIGNRNTKKLHSPDCHALPFEKNRVYFSTKEEAVSRYFEPCQHCCP